MNQEMNNGYVNYQTMLSKINASISELLRLCDELELASRSQSLHVIQDKLQNHSFSVGIMGEFKRGKSTVINALLGKSILPADILPCSATLNQIKWDVKPHAEVHFKDEGKKDVTIDELANYVTKLTEESEQNAANVEEAIVYYPCQFCQNGVKIIDTPGLNDDERMNKIAESVLPTLDAIIMVIVPDAPFSISEADFVRNKVMFSDLARIIFVINKIDTVREHDRNRVIDTITNKIQKSVLEKVSTIYGEDSKEYKESKTKLGGIRVYPLSAMDALDGKLEGNNDLLEHSGMLEFETALTRLLTEERGLLELVAPVNTILAALKEAQDMIVMRKNAMELDKEEFEKIQQEAIEQIEEVRTKKKSEVDRIKAQSKNIYGELLPEIDTMYEELGERLQTCVDTYPLEFEDVRNKEAQQAAATAVSNKLDEELKVYLTENMERLHMRIIDSLGEEISNVNLFNQSIMQNMSSIQCMIPVKGGFDSADIAGVVVDTVTSYSGILAIGGIISGWKANGIPGALVGGGAGFAAGMVAMLAALSIGTVGLPLALIGGVASTFGGKAVTKLVFNRKIKEKDIEKLRSDLRVNVYDSIDTLRRQRVLENWLKDNADQAFFELSEKLDEETETMIESTETTLHNILVDLEHNKTSKEALLQEMEKKENVIKEISEAILPVKNKLDSVIS